MLVVVVLVLGVLVAAVEVVHVVAVLDFRVAAAGLVPVVVDVVLCDVLVIVVVVHVEGMPVVVVHVVDVVAVLYRLVSAAVTVLMLGYGVALVDVRLRHRDKPLRLGFRGPASRRALVA